MRIFEGNIQFKQSKTIYTVKNIYNSLEPKMVGHLTVFHIPVNWPKEGERSRTSAVGIDSYIKVIQRLT